MCSPRVVPYVVDAAADPRAEELVEMQSPAAAASPTTEELAEMQRAQNAWVSESQEQHQYKSRTEMHREKVRQQLGRSHERCRTVGRSLTSGSTSSSGSQQQQQQQNRPHHDQPAHGSDRRYERRDGRTGGDGGYDSDEGSNYSTDTVRPGATSRSGGSARHHERPDADAGPSRSGHRRERGRTPASPPPQPKSSFPATRRDWRPSGDGDGGAF
ncbi:hypothetical protein GGTG_00530 [Gaeumannomyces tritici R3-111a-1]|uniref:Uncharacterized protein n=1 Tax=Gaeumannomyces tritici (strain R3-111a-1) TaxID=644352 RepID=J3NGZ4_GAET3|nr:hypothetical protein GGTG_00530 [Gaeumannomyces tritici R3-111a-1]EJT80534.1 hypothetical protein GGTG_00530 [Gaeumannomyces tritici R3-111a-1]